MSRPRNIDRSQVRSERISLALTPTAIDGLRILAAMQNISVNDLISALVENVVKKNASVIKEFSDAQKKFVARLDFDSCTSAGGGDDNA